MTAVIITEDQLKSISCFVYGGFYDEYEYNAAKELFVQIGKQLLSEALEESYRHGFNDGQAEGMPEALRAERERVLKSQALYDLEIQIGCSKMLFEDHTQDHIEEAYLELHDEVVRFIQSLRSEQP